jgi:C6 transcription factor Pro1
MDGSEKEKLIARGIKDIVKRTSRRRTATTGVTKTSTSTTALAPKTSTTSPENPLQSHISKLEQCTDSAVDNEPPGRQADRSIDVHSNTITTSTVLETDFTASGIVYPVSIDDSVLFMHFLDNVFPLQFPMYRPEVLDGGKGWLLANLLQSKPLYYAALAIGSYHRRMIMLEKLDHSCQISTLIQQEKHLEACLSLVNHYAKNSCPPNGLGIATSVVQLVFYEVNPGFEEIDPTLTNLASFTMAT